MANDNASGRGRGRPPGPYPPKAADGQTVAGGGKGDNIAAGKGGAGAGGNVGPPGDRANGRQVTGKLNTGGGAVAPYTASTASTDARADRAERESDREERFVALVLADPLADPVDAYTQAGYKIAKGDRSTRDVYRLISRLGLAGKIKDARDNAAAELYNRCLISRADVVHSAHDIALIAKGEMYTVDPETGEARYNSAAARDALTALKQIAEIMGFNAPQEVDTTVRVELAPQVDRYGV